MAGRPRKMVGAREPNGRVQRKRQIAAATPERLRHAAGTVQVPTETAGRHTVQVRPRFEMMADAGLLTEVEVEAARVVARVADRMIQVAAPRSSWGAFERERSPSFESRTPGDRCLGAAAAHGRVTAAAGPDAALLFAVVADDADPGPALPVLRAALERVASAFGVRRSVTS